MKKELEFGIKESIEMARKTMNLGYGGPFGAAIIKDGHCIAVASNSVLIDNDPTAHAEINAIRKACSILKTYDLSGCELYATGYPCPMCMSAIIWANITKVYYSCTPSEAENIGFRDDYIYRFLRSEDTSVISLEQIGHDEAIKLFEEYHKNNSIIY